MRGEEDGALRVMAEARARDKDKGESQVIKGGRREKRKKGGGGEGDKEWGRKVGQGGRMDSVRKLEEEA